MKSRMSHLKISSVLLTLMIGSFLVVTVLAGSSASVGQQPVTITLRAADMRFDLSTITVRVGQPVTIRFENDDMMDHAFAIEALNIWSDQISPRQVTSVSFTPQQVGTYQFSCPFPGHAQMGMVGTFEVVA